MDELTISDIDGAWNEFQHLFLSTLKRHIPQRSMSGKKKQVPWLTALVLQRISKRNAARKLAKRKDTPSLWQRFRCLRNKAMEAVRAAKRAFFKSLSSKISTTKDFWRIYYSITSVQQQIPSILSRGVTTATSAFDQATMLNDQFASTFSARDTPLEVPARSGGESCTSLEVIRCSEDKVYHALCAIRPQVAPGPNGILGWMLRGASLSIYSSLTMIFNAFLRLGRVPSAWKNSNVTPIFKSGDAGLALNYRPISLLSLVSKILERQVHDVIQQHLLEHDLLSDVQFGFRPGASTQEAILADTKGWHWSLEKSENVACVFFDLSKAFDSLPHPLILDSLVRVGIGREVLLWIRDYLSDRSQQAVLRRIKSPAVPIKSGVPQGSIQAPFSLLSQLTSSARFLYLHWEGLAFSLMTSATTGLFRNKKTFWLFRMTLI